MYHIHSPSYTMPFNDEDEIYSSSSTDSVDCTLSLGTPSTRITSDDHHPRHHTTSPNWNIFSRNNNNAAPPPNSRTHRPDPLSARRCASCDTTSTPLWRNGPRGPKSLCNACGIRYKKEERRAIAAAAASGATHVGNAVEAQYVMNNGSWTQWPDTAPPSTYEYDGDANAAQSWTYSSYY